LKQGTVSDLSEPDLITRTEDEIAQHWAVHDELKDATCEIQQFVQDQGGVIEELKQTIENYQTCMVREETARHQKFEEKLLEEIQDQVLNTFVR
jgi:hypothetical protein